MEDFKVTTDSEERKKRKTNDLDSDGDFHPSKVHYEELVGHEIFKTEKRVAKVFGIKDKKTGEKFINVKSTSKRPYGWRVNWGVSLYSATHVNSLLKGLRIMAKHFGWNDIEETDNIEKIKTQLRQKEEQILELEKTNEEARATHQELMRKFRKQQQAILKAKQTDFKSEVKELRSLMKQADTKIIPESTLQEFLYDHSWFFGTEYINAEPQKLRGAHSRFDFYLERFNKTRDIVEIKLPSEQIINKDGGINTKVVQAVDQLIYYMESSIAAAHSSVISKEEGIQELRPRGIVVIGKDTSQQAEEKLRMWNYQLAHITILTYGDIVAKAEAVLRHIDNGESK